MSQWRNDPLLVLHFIEVWQAHSSGLWLGHCNTLMLFFIGHSVADLLLCLGKLSCCITQFEKSFSCQKDGLIFESRVLCYTDEFIVECKVLRSFGCKNESKSWPLWSTVSMRFFCQYVWCALQSNISTPQGRCSRCLEKAILVQPFRSYYYELLAFNRSQ